MTSRRALGGLLVALGAAGCQDERVPRLMAELTELKEARIEASMVDRATAEAAEAAEQLAAAEERRTEAQSRLEAAERAFAELRSRFEREVARNETLRGELEELLEQVRAREAEIVELETAKLRLRQRALWVRDQALVFASAYDPDRRARQAEIDGRRDEAFAEFLQRAGEWFPASLDRRELPPPSPERSAHLQDVAAYFTERFELEPPEPAPVASAAPGEAP